MDVFVIGGGPVGIAAAIAARQRGLRVVVADALQPPIDKACGEGLLPWGLEAARRLGVEIPEAQSYPLRGIRFCCDGLSVQAEFPGAAGRGVRRTVLHAAMVRAAERAGVEFAWGRSVQSLAEIPARWIVGADGASSRVRRWAGLTGVRRETRRFGFRMHYAVAPWSEFVEVHWAEGCQIYITPVAGNQAGVALISRDPKLRVAEALRRFPALDTRLATQRVVSLERGAMTSSRTLRQVTRGNVALVGDAAGSVDAISGEGLSMGFHHGFALADAMARNDLSAYEYAHRRLSARPRFMADFMLTMDRREWLRTHAIRALAARPELFRSMLAMHTGEARVGEFAANCALLGWTMLTN